MLALIPLFLFGGGVFYMLSRQGPIQEDDSSAFNVDEVPEEERATGNYMTRFEKDAARRNAAQGPLAGFIPEQDAAFARGPKKYVSSYDQKEEAKKKRSRLEEKAFIKKHDKAIQKELARYGIITRRYRKKYPIVREVDRAFGKMPRYMAVRAQYAKDHDAFAFMRNAIKLPEVRKTIRKYALKSETWRAAIGMANEALKKKPPQPIYDEAVQFMTKDDTMTSWVTDTTTFLGPRVGQLAADGIPPGTDMSALKSVGRDIGVGGKK